MIRFFWETPDPVGTISAESSNKGGLDSAINSAIDEEKAAGPGDRAEDRVEGIAEDLNWANNYVSHAHASSLDDVFDRSQDVPLLVLNLSHEEGKPATLSITVPHGAVSATEAYRGRRGMVMYQKNGGKNDQNNRGKNRLLDAQKHHRLFYGHLVEILEKEDVTELRLVSDLFPIQDQWEVVAQEIKSKAVHHDLWDNHDPENLLACVPYTRYWDRCTGKMRISHAVKGTRTFDVSHVYDPKYRVTHKKEPVSDIKMEISVHWDQKIMGYTNIAPQIASCFPKGVMGTLTDRALESGWPETGRTFSSGYFVSESSLKKINDARHPSGIVLPGASEAGEDSQDAQEQSDWIAECSFYEGRLVVGYAYRQKRKEILTYTLQAALPDSEKGRSATIALNVPDFVQHDDAPQWHPMGFYQDKDIVQHEGRIYQYRENGWNAMNGSANRRIGLQRSHEGAEKSQEYWEELPEKTKWLLPIVSPSFFTEKLGKEIFIHSLERAKTALIWGTRCIEDKIRGTIDDLHAITLDDAIVLPVLDNAEQKITGKVVAYTLHMNVMKNMGYVEILGAFPLACQKKSEQDLAQNIDKNIGPHLGSHVDNTENYTTDTIQDITYAWPKKNPPPDTVSETMGQGICKNIVVKNHIQDQLECIKKIKQDMISDQWDPEQVQSKETRITLQFHSLNTKECLEHPIPVQILTPFFYAP